jgi:methionyl-tRNA formyltransferase
MDRKNLKVVFMGTPTFAVPSLEKLINSGYHVSAVVTAPDRKSGRGRKVQPSPVKEFAVSKGLKVLQPDKLRDENFVSELKTLQPDVMVVVAFRMLPDVVWTIPSLGTFNLHASLLPQYRGAAPINHAIINGETESGLTTFYIDHEIDTGKIITNKTMPIGRNESFGELHNRMMEAGAELVAKTMDMISSGRAVAIDQKTIAEDPERLRKAPKISKEFCRINWQADLSALHNFIRGLSPYPGAYTYLNTPGQDPEYFKILESEKKQSQHKEKPGQIFSDGKTYFKVSVPGGYLHLKRLQQSGKRAVAIADFLNGFTIKSGMFFE